ncbi:MAG TPA: hypothetical protein VI197_12830 [Polyangiaceae bacterium]
MRGDLPFRRPSSLEQRSKLEPEQIARNPELALLEAADALLDTATAAMIAAHPDLLGPRPFERGYIDSPAPAAKLYAADAVLSLAFALRAAMDRYRCAIDFEHVETE